MLSDSQTLLQLREYRLLLFSGVTLDVTALVAWIGAVTGVSGLAWDFYKWRRSRPRVSVFAEHGGPMLLNTGATTADGSLILEGVPWNLITVTITNIGGEATTISNVTIVSYRSWWAQIRKRPSFLNAYGPGNEAHPLPHKLGVGEQWHGEITRDNVASDFRDAHRLWCHVYHSWSRSPIDAPVVAPSKYLP